MKISKIFHSLYAFLMFLPVCAVLGTTLYSILNPNAKDSYSGSAEYTTQELVYQYETETPSIAGDDYWSLTTGHAYNLVFVASELVASGANQGADIFNDLGADCTILSYNNIDTDFTFQGIFLTHFDFLSFTYNYSYNSLSFEFDDYLDENWALSLSGFRHENYSISFVHNGDDIISSPDNFYYLEACPLENIPYTVQTITHDSETLDNAFSYSVNSLYSNPLFSWCNNSFLTEPFHYIGDLFGLPRDNAINTLFSYWLNISIIWLCFDVIMYVPLLCHRWIDKGGLE